jgi:hypothetical protein
LKIPLALCPELLSLYVNTNEETDIHQMPKKTSNSAFRRKMPKLSGSAFRLLTPGNPKVAKGQKKGYLTFILHLAPAKLSGYEVCPKRSAGCTQACLNTAERGGMMSGVSALTFAMVESGIQNTIQKARIRRTKRFFEERQAFMSDLVRDIRKAIAFAEKWDLIPVFRLNGTSDIRWETVGIASEMGRRIFDIFPTVQFYDYTKIENRRNIPSNYDLTFSRADGNETSATIALFNGMRVAAVYRSRAVVERYMTNGHGGFAVIDGDDSDLRFLEPKGVIVGLYAKGNAKRDTSGFVID